MKAILFDMDGTLVPMDEKLFTKGYFMLLAQKLAPFGIEPQKLIDSVWAGTKKMYGNDGSRTNEEAFWETFYSCIPQVDKGEIKSVCDEFYVNEFNNAKKFTLDNPLAIEAVRAAHEKADKVILATNPLFPKSGQLTRLAWVGLKESDFDLVTSYETENFCKPNPNYYLSVLKKMNLKAEDCLMIGNDETEDMFAASSVGMDCFFVNDTPILSDKCPWQGKKGSFSETICYINGIQA